MQSPYYEDQDQENVFVPESYQTTTSELTTIPSIQETYNEASEESKTLLSDDIDIGIIIVPPDLSLISSSQPSLIPIPLNYPVNLQRVHTIKGWEFNLNFENEQIVLSHNKWSLIGVGSTLLDAENDLLNEAKELADHFLDIPIYNLDANGIELREFLLDLL